MVTTSISSPSKKKNSKMHCMWSINAGKVKLGEQKEICTAGSRAMGMKKSKGRLIPVQTDLPPAPDELL